MHAAVVVSHLSRREINEHVRFGAHMSISPLLLLASVLGTTVSQAGASSSTTKAPKDRRVLLDQLVATVDNHVITLSEVQKNARPFLAQNQTTKRRNKLYEDVLEQLINEKLLEKQITEADINVSEGEVQAAIEDILRQNRLTPDQLQEAVVSRGITYEDYKHDVKKQLVQLKLIDLKVRSKIVITEEDLRAEYESRVRAESAKTKVSISHILLRFGDNATDEEKQRIEEQAEDVRRLVGEQPESFGEVAKELSQGPTAAKGGSLGELDELELLPALAAAIHSLEPGQISNPVVTPNGIHIVKLDQRRQEGAQSFEQMAGLLRRELQQQRSDDQMKVWLNELRRDSAINILKSPDKM
ncbi:MAG: peptidylprolyl isomerase [Myxococcales bacterium]|nr:peptidylprolyl isomerase [Myxococcales bacterium]